MQAFEVNFDGIVGPSHNYGALSFGNVASIASGSGVSQPKQAALQGLKKMKALHDLGLKQAVLPPHDRPHISTLRQLGFRGSDGEVLVQAATVAPEVFAACCSASSMWTANAATVSPSADSFDGKVHFTPANLSNKFHRSIEYLTTARALKAIFTDTRYFHHHDALPLSDYFGDEGAANHTRFCQDYNDPGVQLFVFGRYGFKQSSFTAAKFPARQSYEASAAISRLHQLSADKVVFAQQHPDMIDAGVFHNDVISVGNKNVMLYHENAFVDTDLVIEALTSKFLGENFYPLKVKNNEVSVNDAVKSYLFNSQLVSVSHDQMIIIAPQECYENKAVHQWLMRAVEADNPIRDVKFFDLKQSMKNGGGPACLRLRVVLTEQELAAMNSSVLLTDELYHTLVHWVERHYRDELVTDNLQEVKLLEESYVALNELTEILNLGAIYSFQR
ncbi:succinylarginine dihydrolase [Piscirickettsia salmonis]|uniref:N-succinylarginine dihydrolase n=2 Tax=Piscirickettsia salmonis TaxID=1238 RepID=A0A9Q6LPQ2_PISSA|nr:N-succinylarginine dihydrolase [Piscirickettsia salmonis]RNC78747.1 N-succinylarginine dihydrolase [Piscirickettsiaceae bacterium NZ-RLO2]ALA25590.1 N-succinylarginine dihydrolase [Piscirickettsia salmonis]APS43096.1 succinylarginine dihydrolase [Piscirickettsia salmonis]APS46443.1 succinylarginine dihydrolase [Piscirickettsia salmonis]APS50411.1 succinylarginine dihydrolase [Piscirickettsia salmonis]